jgi:hypothetical protein
MTLVRSRRRRSNGNEEGGCAIGDLVLAERAREDGARSMRAVTVP